MMKNQRPESDAVIAIVDDDPSVRKGLQRLIRSAGWKAETFASAQEFLDRPRTEEVNAAEQDPEAEHQQSQLHRPRKLTSLGRPGRCPSRADVGRCFG